MLRVALQARSYRNLAYAVTILPLALAYAILLIALGTLGVLLLPTLVGIPILGGTVAVWWSMGELERVIGVRLLRVDVRPLVRPRVPSGHPRLRWWRIASAYLTSYQTWMTLGYLVLKIPFGLLALIAAGGLAVLSVGMLIAPVILMVTAAVDEMHLAEAVAIAALMIAGGYLVGIAALHASNAVAWAATLLLRLMLGQGDPTQHIAVATATAARAEARADRAERSRQELIVNVGHELRTPTANIRGHVESLLLRLEGADGETSPSTTDLRHHLGIVERETQRLGTLIDELLTLARSDAGELRLELAPVQPADVVEEIYQSLALLARRERQVTLTRGTQPGLRPVLADRQRLVQVLLNLVRNAITYTPEGGIVAVTAEPGGPENPGRVAFTVIDTGIGISPEDLPHVFERFYRADPSRTRASGGFGLGLAIVQDLVRAMGGTIDVESQLGEGTRFRVLLPTS